MPGCRTAGKMKDRGEITKVLKRGRKINKECNTSGAFQLDRLLKGNENLLTMRKAMCWIKVRYSSHLQKELGDLEDHIN